MPKKQFIWRGLVKNHIHETQVSNWGQVDSEDKPTLRDATCVSDVN